MAVVLGACGGSAPEVPLGPDGEPDPILVVGREVYGARCASCHGNEGQGGRGPRLNNGETSAAYPDIEGLVAVIRNGKGSGMPAFASTLSATESEAVARYVMEVLD